MSNIDLWVPQLRRRYERIEELKPAGTTGLVKELATLQLTDAVINNAQVLADHPNLPLQVAVIGPTQSGKSTLVNVLLEQQHAGISALAGFTVHAQGYALACQESQLSTIDSMMHPLQRIPLERLSGDSLTCYSLQSIDKVDGNSGWLSNSLNSTASVIWDTPDFDSISAKTYTLAVIKSIAMADILLLVVSKDKYGDKSVWDTLVQIQPLNKSLIVCINKIDEQDIKTVGDAFKQRHFDVFGDQPLPTIIFIPFIRHAKNTPQIFPDTVINSLASAVSDANRHIDRSQYRSAAEQLVMAHQEAWFAPLLEEQNAQRIWQMHVDEQIQLALETYVQEYLNRDDGYETFNRTLAELLNLLEIPGIASTLIKTRKVITWPARKLLNVGKSAWSSKVSDDIKTPDDLEGDILQRIFQDVYVALHSNVIDQDESEYWRTLNRSLRLEKSRINIKYNLAFQQARQEFEPEIELAAKKLYEQLQSQPALLNTLRAARATADAAAVALAVKSGGLAPADLVLAPAMLSVTTLLTESALGRYLDTVKEDLKRRQKEHIYEHVIKGSLGNELGALIDSFNNDQLYTQRMEPELEAAMAGF